MKKFRYLIMATVPLIALGFCISSLSLKNKESNNISKVNIASTDNNNVAVLELFTSQGCSSCPSADRLLGTYTSKENVIVLSFHVDYWNRLGWKDPYSSKNYTQRQHDYASALHADIYTPQIIINGESEMVGSDAVQISNTIDKVFSEKSEATLAIKSVKADNGKASINFDASGNTGKSTLNVALVEKETITDIKGGENGGVTLTSYNVVRNFKTINKIHNGDNSTTIDIPSSIDEKNMSVVLYLQEKGNNKISGAAQATF